MDASEVIKAVVTVFSSIALCRIATSPRFKEASSKNGSLFVNYIVMSFLWILISYLLHSFFPATVVYGNILLLIYFAPYVWFYKMTLYLFQKAQTILMYYVEKYKLLQCVQTSLNYVNFTCTYIFTAMSTRSWTFAQYLYDWLLYPLLFCICENVTWLFVRISPLITNWIFYPLSQCMTKAVGMICQNVTSLFTTISQNGYLIIKWSYKWASYSIEALKWCVCRLTDDVFKPVTQIIDLGTKLVKKYVWNLFIEFITEIVIKWLFVPVSQCIRTVITALCNICCKLWFGVKECIKITIRKLYAHIFNHCCVVLYDAMIKMYEVINTWIYTVHFYVNIIAEKLCNYVLPIMEICGSKILSTCRFIWCKLCKLYCIILVGYDMVYDGLQYLMRLILFYHRIYSSQIMLTKQHIDISIQNRYATIKYEYIFENQSKYEKSEELKFEITIHKTAFISCFIADINGKTFYGETKEKKQSNKQYKQAVKENKNAILITKPYNNIPNVFKISTNISRKSKIKLIISIEQFIEKVFGFNELTVELLNQFLAYNINNSFEYTTFNIDINENSGIYGFEIMSPKNIKISKKNKNDGKYSSDCKLRYDYNVLRKNNASEMVLKYKLKGEENESIILLDKATNTFCHIMSNTDIINFENEEYFIPKRVVFIVDKSQSMKGIKWKQTTKEISMTLNRLRKDSDKYSIILFDTYIYENNKCLIDANDKNIDKSIEYMNNIKPSGTTNIYDALMAGLRMFIINNRNRKKEEENDIFMNQMIFITDGRATEGVTNASTILRNVKSYQDKLKKNKACIYCFGISEDNSTSYINDLNYSFLRELASTNNGFAIRVKQSETSNNLSKYLKVLSNPLLLDLNIAYKSHIININNTTKTYFHSLYNGSDIIVCGKITDEDCNYDENKQYRHEGTTYQDEEEEEEEEEKFEDKNSLNVVITARSGKLVNVSTTNNNHNNQIQAINLNKKLSFKTNDILNNTLDENTENIERIWAYLNLQNCYNLTYDRFDHDQIDDKEKKKKKYLLDLSMKFKFVTPYTNMIVVENGKETNNATKVKRQIKLVMVGDYNCGKTELLLKYTQRDTTQTSIFHKNVMIDKNDIDLEIWDIPNGEEVFSSFKISPISLRNANGIIYVCSINDLKSQNNIKKWMNNIAKSVNTNDNEMNSVLIANKSDLISDDNEKEQIKKRLESLSNDLGIKYVITSAKQNINVSNGFRNILRGICNRLNIEEKASCYMECPEQQATQYRLRKTGKKKKGTPFIDNLVGNSLDDDDDEGLRYGGFFMPVRCMSRSKSITIKSDMVKSASCSAQNACC